MQTQQIGATKWSFYATCLAFGFEGMGFEMWIQTDLKDKDAWEATGRVDWVRVWDHWNHIHYDIELRRSIHIGGPDEVQAEVWLPSTETDVTKPWPTGENKARRFRMSPAEHAQMRRIMRKCMSYRTDPLPDENLRRIWREALSLVKRETDWGSHLSQAPTSAKQVVSFVEERAE